MRRKDIRKSEWFEEISDYFDLSPDILKRAVPKKRIELADEPVELREAKKKIAERYISAQGINLWEKILFDHPSNITDNERSNSWKEYIFLCINGERRGFQRISFYDRLIRSVVTPLLNNKDSLTVLDYGCGPSLFTRLLSQDFPGRIQTISADVCKYSVAFSVARNRIYNRKAKGILIEDVMSVPELRNIDIILAYCVFEHLPNSTHQIKGLIDALNTGGILIENYSGHSSLTPHKSDTFSAYAQRDVNLDMIKNRLNLLFGVLPEKHNGIYERDSGERFWVKGDIDEKVYRDIRRRLHNEHRFIRKFIGALIRKIR